MQDFVPIQAGPLKISQDPLFQIEKSFSKSWPSIFAAKQINQLIQQATQRRFELLLVPPHFVLTFAQGTVYRCQQLQEQAYLIYPRDRLQVLATETEWIIGYTYIHFNSGFFWIFYFIFFSLIFSVFFYYIQGKAQGLSQFYYIHGKAQSLSQFFCLFTMYMVRLIASVRFIISYTFMIIVLTLH